MIKKVEIKIYVKPVLWTRVCYVPQKKKSSAYIEVLEKRHSDSESSIKNEIEKKYHIIECYVI